MSFSESQKEMRKVEFLAHREIRLRRPAPSSTLRIVEIVASELSRLIVSRKHGIFPDQARQIGQLSNEDLIRFRLEDPISATQREGGLSLTGGHHRTNEIIQRVQGGQMDPATIVKVLIHD